MPSYVFQLITVGHNHHLENEPVAVLSVKNSSVYFLDEFKSVKHAI